MSIVSSYILWLLLLLLQIQIENMGTKWQKEKKSKVMTDE